MKKHIITMEVTTEDSYLESEEFKGLQEYVNSGELASEILMEEAILDVKVTLVIED